MPKNNNDTKFTEFTELLSEPTDTELAKSLLGKVRETPNLFRHAEKALLTEDRPVSLRAVMEADGIKASTPLSDFIGSEYRPMLLAADMGNVIKQRFLEPTTTALQETERLMMGVIPRGVGTMHRPRLLDVCGGGTIVISDNPQDKDGKIGYWKPFPDFDARHTPMADMAMIRPDYIETEDGYFYRYAFYIEVSRGYARSDITLSSFGKWLETVFIAIETRMWQDYYNTILRYNDSDNVDAEDVEVNTKDLGAKQIGSEYPMDEDAWRALHRAFGTMHGMTDVFTDADQDNGLKGLDIGNNQVVLTAGGTDFTEFRNRLADGTYVWSQFLTDAQPNIQVGVDRQSSVSLFELEGSERSERDVSILTDSFAITFSIALGFRVTDPAGVKVVKVTT